MHRATYKMSLTLDSAVVVTTDVKYWNKISAVIILRILP